MTLQPTGDEKITPRSEWLGVLREATAEVFSMMVGASVAAPEAANGALHASDAVDSPMAAYVTGVIGIAGAVHAVFSLRCSENSATRIAAQMLGMTTDQAGTQKSDAIGEVCNIVAGHFKHKIGYGDNCKLTVPTVIVGGNYSVHSTARGERLEFPVNYEGETVWVALDIRN